MAPDVPYDGGPDARVHLADLVHTVSRFRGDFAWRRTSATSRSGRQEWQWKNQTEGLRMKWIVGTVLVTALVMTGAASAGNGRAMVNDEGITADDVAVVIKPGFLGHRPAGPIRPGRCSAIPPAHIGFRRCRHPEPASGRRMPSGARGEEVISTGRLRRPAWAAARTFW